MKFIFALYILMVLGACSSSAPRSWTSQDFKNPVPNDTLQVYIMDRPTILNVDDIEDDFENAAGSIEERFVSFCSKYIKEGIANKGRTFKQAESKWIKEPVSSGVIHKKIQSKGSDKISNFSSATYDSIVQKGHFTLILDKLKSKRTRETNYTTDVNSVAHQTVSDFLTIRLNYMFYDKTGQLQAFGWVRRHEPIGLYMSKGDWKDACFDIGSGWDKSMQTGKENYFSDN
jgi:hypothetical protein